MTILLPVLAVAFAAFCVWLAVRIVNRRERWAKWTAMAVVAISILYTLSSGPMRTVAFRHRLTYANIIIRQPPIGSNQTAGYVIPEIGRTVFVMDKGEWWPTVYAPLAWASEQFWGGPLNWYWNLFPIRVAAVE